MFNSNPNIGPPLSPDDIKKKVHSLDVTESEKQELINSLSIIGRNFTIFVRTFEETYSEKIPLKFLQNMSEETLINMLSSALNLIISSINENFPLDEYLNVLTETHPYFLDIVKIKDLFHKSLMKAVIDSLGSFYTEKLGVLWFKAVLKFNKLIIILF